MDTKAATRDLTMVLLANFYYENVYSYRQDRDVKIASKFETLVLSGEAILPGFDLPMTNFKVAKG